MSNAVQVLIFDRFGREPVLIEPTIEYVAWRLNRTGQARMSLPYTDANCTKERLRYGNRVLVQFGNGLPDFGGVIDVPRGRGDVGVAFSVYTADRILSWRRTKKIRSFSEATPGTIFQTLLRDANDTYPTGISLASAMLEGSPRTQEYNYAPLLAAFEELHRFSGEELIVRPVFSGGNLSFEAYWRVVVGSDLSDKVLLADGENIKELALDEQGPIASDIYVAGGSAGGTEWTDRLVGIDTNITSRDEYDFREYAKIISGVFDQATLDATAEALASELNDPREHLKCTALNVDPAPFNRYDIGDTVTVHGFVTRSGWTVNAAKRIYGREWAPENTCRLELQ